MLCYKSAEEMTAKSSYTVCKGKGSIKDLLRPVHYGTSEEVQAALIPSLLEVTCFNPF
jgi:hypothetical protein